jgi:hypothetical protein
MPGGPPLAPGQPKPPPAPAGGDKPKPKPAEPKRGMALNGVPALWQEEIETAMLAATEAGDVALAEVLHRGLADDAADLPVPSAVAASLEPRLVRGLVRVWLAHQERLDLGALEAGCGPTGVHGDLVTALAPAVLGRAQTAVLEAFLQPAVLRGADLGASALRHAGVAVRAVGQAEDKAAAISVDLSAVNPESIRWAREHAGALVQSPAQVRAIVNLLVQRAVAEGITPYELARMLRDVVGLTAGQALAVANFRERLADEGVEAARREQRVSRYAAAQLRARGLTIARTELIGALNGGQQLLWNSAVAQRVISATQFEKVWIVTPDERLEAQCEALDGVQVPIAEQFPGGLDHPPAHPRCRCAQGLAAAKRKAAA